MNDNQRRITNSSVPQVNENELLGFIMREVTDYTINAEEVQAVLDAELKFLMKKGIATKR